jgi:hypothetical protein
MTTSLDRRLFIAGSVTVLMLSLGANAVPPDESEDWGVFSKLAGIFVAIQAATQPIADGITRLKFVRFLNGIQGPLTDILREKNAVLDALEIGTCTTDARTVEAMASRPAQRIIPLVTLLQQKVATLSTAIKPGDTRQAATELANDMSRLQSRKMWVHQLNGFCGRPPADRAAFVARVKQSIAIVQEAQKKLDALLDHLTE